MSQIGQSGASVDMGVLVVTAMYVYSHTTYNIFCHHNLDSTPKICLSPTIPQGHLRLRHKFLSSHAHSVGAGTQPILSLTRRSMSVRWLFALCSRLAKDQHLPSFKLSTLWPTLSVLRSSPFPSPSYHQATSSYLVRTTINKFIS